MRPRNRRTPVYGWLAVGVGLLTVVLPVAVLVTGVVLDSAGHKEAGTGLAWVGVLLLMFLAPLGGVATVVLAVLALANRAGADTRDDRRER